MGYFCPKNTFIQLKHNTQRIYPSLLSTTCVTIHQMTYVISETISHFSRHSPSIFFSSNITYFLAKQPIKVKIFRLATARIKTDQVPHVIYLGFIQILHQCSVSSKITPLYFFLLKPHILQTKIVHQSGIFGLLSGQVKIHKIPHVIFETTIRFFFKFRITLQCHER